MRSVVDIEIEQLLEEFASFDSSVVVIDFAWVSSIDVLAHFVEDGRHVHD